ncbi:hypothetical protein EMPG_11529 [Blastomyces silverae]|uniref:Uncharacterized protein n=1 Tax=Blastomyces silverae TaxID=2060906 RepID=A0A0H1BQC7_9EURO|nr:hypothetical protein EMPG_11529 [Blastomyces silverae]
MSRYGQCDLEIHVHPYRISNRQRADDAFCDRPHWSNKDYFLASPSLKEGPTGNLSVVGQQTGKCHEFQFQKYPIHEKKEETQDRMASDFKCSELPLDNRPFCVDRKVFMQSNALDHDHLQHAPSHGCQLHSIAGFRALLTGTSTSSINRIFNSASFDRDLSRHFFKCPLRLEFRRYEMNSNS